MDKKIKKELKERSDLFGDFNPVLSYFKLKKLLKYYEKLINNTGQSKNIYTALVYRNYIICLYEYGEYFRALEVTEESLGEFPDYPDLYYIRGQIYWELSEVERARFHFNRCTQFKSSPKYITVEGVTGYLAYEKIADSFAFNDNYSKAVEYTNKALFDNFSYNLLLKLCNWLQRDGYSGKKIIEYLNTLFNLKPETLGQLLYECNEYEACINFIDNNEGKDMLILKTKSIMNMNNFKKAEKILKLKLNIMTEKKREVFKLLCINSWLQKPGQSVEKCLANFNNDNRDLSPYLKADKILFNSCNPVVNSDEEEVIYDIALELLKYGGEDLAKLLIDYLCHSDGGGDPIYILGKLAVDNSLYKMGKELIENRLKDNVQLPPQAFYYAGLACAKMNLYPEAFQYFWTVSNQFPENEINSASAFEQLLDFCIKTVKEKIIVINNNKNIKEELYQYISLKKKISWIKEVIVDERKDN